MSKSAKRFDTELPFSAPHEFNPCTHQVVVGYTANDLMVCLVALAVEMAKSPSGKELSSGKRLC